MEVEARATALRTRFNLVDKLKCLYGCVFWLLVTKKVKVNIGIIEEPI
jgi:hypothetical protein